MPIDFGLGLDFGKVVEHFALHAFDALKRMSEHFGKTAEEPAGSGGK